MSDNAFIINKEFFFSDVESVFEEFNIPQMRSFLILCQEVLTHLNESFLDFPVYDYPVTFDYLSKCISFLDDNIHSTADLDDSGGFKNENV